MCIEFSEVKNVLFRSVVVVGALLTLVFSSVSFGAAQQSRTVATISSADYRVVLLASKTSAGASPTARVSVNAYVHQGKGWSPIRTTKLPETYFWKVITAAHAVCQLQFATAAKPSLAVSLLVTPSIGCGRSERVPLTNN
jgi:hypothetical protein